jgi:hypothetical protein
MAFQNRALSAIVQRCFDGIVGLERNYFTLSTQSFRKENKENDWHKNRSLSAFARALRLCEKIFHAKRAEVSQREKECDSHKNDSFSAFARALRLCEKFFQSKCAEITQRLHSETEAYELPFQRASRSVHSYSGLYHFLAPCLK